MSRQTTVDSLLLSVAGGQPSDSNHSIAIVCSNESTAFFCFSKLEGARASTGLCVDVSSGVMI